MRARTSSGSGWTVRKQTNKRGKSELSKSHKYRREDLRVERLEDRLLLTATPVGSDNWGSLFGDGTTGLEPDQLAAQLDAGTTAGAPLSSVPQLHSNPGATAKLYLDFDGHFEASWGSYTNVTTPAFDRDGDPTTFSSGELSSIYEIWARVSEDYAPFNVDVTTVDPGSQANKVVAVVAIGGSNSDWYGGSVGGIAYVGGFYNSSPNVGYVFSNSLSNVTKYVAEGCSHESGHLFGLQHQAQWSGTTLVTQYSQGSGDWAPIMGNSYYATRTTWANGPTPSGPTAYEDELAILSGSNDGFGYKTDDYGSTIATASSLPIISGTTINFSGLIAQASDQDVWSFTTTGGTVTFQLTGAQYGSNLDGVLEIRNSSGTTIASDSPSNSYGASVTTTLAAGTYYLVAHSVGDYGDMGQYTITGSLPAAGTSPEIDLSVGGVGVADGGTIDFGTTTAGTSVTKTITVANQGNAVLNLTALNSGSLPTGFTLISNLGATSLNPGSSTTFIVRLDATAPGTYSGSIQLSNDDSDENPYDLTLSGTVTAPEIDIAISGVGVADGQTVNFGSTALGQSVSRTFTVTNSGTATLSLTALDSAAMPAGFMLTSNLGSTSLAPGQSTTFSIQLDASSAGSYGGTVQLFNNDSNENPYDLVLTGSVAAPEIDIAISGVGVADGQTVDFGSSGVGQSVSRTFTITNTGTETLTLTALDASTMPVGFALTANLGSTSLAAGESTTFSVSLDAASLGTYGGSIQLFNNDSDENPYDLVLTGKVTAPEIDIAISGVGVADGQTVDFGSITAGHTTSRTFTVTNTGTATLLLTTLDPASLPTGFTLTSNLGSTSLAAGQSTTFTIEFDPSVAGTFSGSIALTNTDSDENPYVIELQGVAAAPAPAKLTMFVGGQELSLGGAIDFGSTVTGSTLELTFWIRNDGASLLTLSPIDPASLPSGFSLYQDLTSTSLAPNQETSFILRLDALAAGSYSGLVSLASSDPDSPFNFQVKGTVSDPIAPVLRIVDDGDAGAVQSGSWQRTTGKGYGGDGHIASSGSGGAVYSWGFGSLPAGQYQVWATWASGGANATNAPFSLFDGGSKLTTVAVNQRVAPSGLTASGASWRLLGTVTVNSGQLTVKLTNAANGRVVADAIRVERVITVPAPLPEIGIADASSELTSGTSIINFGIRDLGQSQVRTFTITNHGKASLTLTPLNPANLPAGFSLEQNIGSTFLTRGESTTFKLRLNANAAGIFAGTISLANNDNNESPFHFQVSGTVYDPSVPLVRITDDGSAGNTRSGSWTHDTTKGYSGDQWTSISGNGSSSSAWTFTNLPNGQYRIQATWRPASINATNSPYSLYNGGQLVKTVQTNQRLAPSDVWDGAWWKTLGTVTVTGNQVTVKLTNAANGYVVADAIRIERIVTANESLVNSFDTLTSLAASQQETGPDAMPLPADLPPQLWTNTALIQPAAAPVALPGGSFDLEDGLHSALLDLLAGAQHALMGTPSTDLQAAYGLALNSLLGQSS